MTPRRFSLPSTILGRIWHRIISFWAPYFHEAVPFATFRSWRRRSMSGHPKEKLARAGEKQAARHLRRQGYRVLARNVLLPGGEIDLVARDGQCIVFVEVKTRQDILFGRPQEAVTSKKRQRMAKLAHQFLRQQHLKDVPIRFDIIAILWPRGQQPQIEHLIDAFDAPHNT